MLDEIAALKARWLELYPRMAEVRDTMLAYAIRWEYANWLRYDPRPFYFRRDRPRGHLLRNVVSARENSFYIYRCGYDAQGRTIVDGEEKAWQHLYSYDDNAIEVINFQPGYNLLRGLGRLELVNGRPASFIEFRLLGHSEYFRGSAEEIWQQALTGKPLHFAIDREIYDYTGDRLTQINLTRWSDNRHLHQESKLYELEYRLDYDANGHLQQITLNDERILYRQRQPGETLAVLAEAAKSRLIAAIPEAIQRANFTEPLYCLKLQYLDDYFFPPTLEPGRESWRNHVRDTQIGIYVRNMIWASARSDDDDAEYPIEDKAALDACAALQIETGYAMGNYRRNRFAIRTLREVARALNQIDWSKYAPVTPDFIVFAYDQEGIITALRYCGATSAQIADWKKRGFF